MRGAWKRSSRCGSTASSAHSTAGMIWSGTASAIADLPVLPRTAMYRSCSCRSTRPAPERGALARRGAEPPTSDLRQDSPAAAPSAEVVRYRDEACGRGARTAPERALPRRSRRSRPVQPASAVWRRRRGRPCASSVWREVGSEFARRPGRQASSRRQVGSGTGPPRDSPRLRRLSLAPARCPPFSAGAASPGIPQFTRRRVSMHIRRCHPLGGPCQLSVKVVRLRIVTWPPAGMATTGEAAGRARTVTGYDSGKLKTTSVPDRDPVEEERPSAGHAVVVQRELEPDGVGPCVADRHGIPVPR